MTTQTSLIYIRRQAEILVANAAQAGAVVTIVQKPTLPLSMGNYTTEIEVRPVRENVLKDATTGRPNIWGEHRTDSPTAR